MPPGSTPSLVEDDQELTGLRDLSFPVRDCARISSISPHTELVGILKCEIDVAGVVDQLPRPRRFSI
jgi:hypothetical protein